MQKRRVWNKAIVFFQTWSIKMASVFKLKFFIFFYRTSLIKLKFVKKFKKRFRKPFRRKRLFLLFFCKPNYLVHNKFKNARMGKGKGSPVIWVYKPVLNKPAAILGGINVKRAQSIMSYFRKHLTPHMYMRKVEIVHIKVTFHSFNKWSATRHLKGDLKEKLFNLYFMFYMSSALNKPRIQVRKKIKRTFVVLKSPFHYKTPKHHIQYSYYSIHATIGVKIEYAKKIRNIMSSFFLQNKPNRVQENRPRRLALSGLL